MVLETKRLILRELEPGDFEALRRVLADSDIMRHYPYTFDDARVRGWIAKNIERYRMLGFGLWAVSLRRGGELIGDCGLTMQRIDGAVLPEIGYHIRGDCQCRGYAREAVSAVRDWAFGVTPFHVLYSYMKHDNEPSRRTAMSIGCRFARSYEDEEGERTDVFAIIRDEWRTDVFAITRDEWRAGAER